VLTVVGGKVVHGEGDFSDLAPPLPAASPDWSPVGRYQRFAPTPAAVTQRRAAACCVAPCGVHGHRHLFASAARAPVGDRNAFWGALGCGCAF
jgi:hypothetical protein